VPDGPERSGKDPSSIPAPAMGALSALLAQLAVGPEPQDDAAAAALWPGCEVGRFTLVRELGRGGFGVVYEALDRQLGRLVAFKAIRPGARLRTRFRQESLRREAETAAQLSHPNIATLHDAGQSEHGPYLVFELLEGETLRDRLDRGPLPIQQGVRIAIEVARALAYAHASGVVHCDLKPSNVFLGEDGVVKVLDFGIARVFGEARAESGGTPAYMAPEQWRGEQEHPQTDVFTLGSMLQEMLTGDLPFEVTRDRSSALDPGPAPPLRVPEAPATLVAFVAAALDKDSAARPRNGQAALEALLDVERELAGRGGGRRWLRWAIAAAAIVAMLATAAVFALRQWNGAAPERIVVAVADFANETGDPELDGLSGLLITSLEQSRRLSVLTRSRMLDALEQLGKSKVERVDEPLAREVGRHVGARALVFASIRRFGAIYTVELKAFDPTGDVYLFTVKEEADGKTSIPAVLDRLSERARRALREPAREVQASRVKIADAVTGNLEAYRHYFLGVQCEDETFSSPSCRAHFERALEVDPTFALARYRLAVGAEGAGETTSAEQQRVFEAALRHVDRFPAKERRTLLAWKAHLGGDDAGALATYEALAADYPQDKHVAYMLGEFLFHFRNDGRAALPWFERVLQLDPGHSFALGHVLDVLHFLGRTDELVPVASRSAASSPGPATWVNLARAYALAGQLGPAIGWMQRAAEVGSDAARRDLATLRLLAGDHAGAEADYRRLLEIPGFRYDAFKGLASIRALQGRRREGRHMLESLDRETPSPRAVVFRIAYAMADGRVDVVRAERAQLRDLGPMRGGPIAAELAYAGDLGGAAEAARDLATGSIHDRAYRAVVQWRMGEASAAADRLGEIVSESAWMSQELWFHAEALFDARRFAEAVKAMERYQHDPVALEYTIIWGWAYPKSLYLLARCHEELGEPEQAREEVEKLLALWKNADPDLPLLAEARALRARLAKADRARLR
jgi:eukaryotic-like serine/threonine-protein kinase